jgi:hypothetical protein
MNRCSYFIENKAIFGGYPTQDEVNFLEEKCQVKYFIDLTEDNETGTEPYKTKYFYYKYPIKDNYIPTNSKSFAKLILEICKLIEELESNEKIYIHCKGGHGRSAFLVTCILIYHKKISIKTALQLTKEFHSKRPNLREKWKNMQFIPHLKIQRNFIYNFFKNYYYGSVNEKATYIEHSKFDDDLSCEIVISNIGTFPSSYHAYKHYKDPENRDYVELLKKGIYKRELINKQENWEDLKINYMYEVLKHKFQQHPELKEELFKTRLKKLEKNIENSFWGNGKNGKGKNIHGWLLEKLREHFLFSEN